ncbi:hypothetical protein [Candidatus Nitrosacidococcus sp. I8]|uniref:hypothetical protein n=1 Tax=Candidatus Nitrosacidococcus sp. I8 TaxID=2942908 RepID=UPI002227013E|nr:hypothetical protein [Candidatus Nitrosacidococcus sp. I8]
MVIRILLLLSAIISIDVAHGALMYKWVPTSDEHAGNIWITAGDIIIHNNSYQLGHNYDYSIPASVEENSPSYNSGGGISIGELSNDSSPPISFSFDLMDDTGVMSIAAFNNSGANIGGTLSQYFNNIDTNLTLNHQLSGNINIKALVNDISISSNGLITVGADGGNFCGGNASCSGQAFGSFVLVSSVPEPHIFWLFSIGFLL